MKSNRLRKIDNFANRHLLLSSFLCLIILGFIINFYWAFDNRESSFTFVGVEEYISMIKLSIFLTFFFGSIPIFFISLLLYSFLKRKSSVYNNLSFYQKFIISFIPAFIIMLLFYLCIASSSYKPSDYYPGAVFISSVYSVIFATFFGWFSNASKTRIIVQCFIVNLLMVFFNIIMCFLQSPVM
jgi:hypothetical protein